MRRRTGALTIPLGRLAGVPIRAHWTWPLVTLAVAGALADIYRRGPGGERLLVLLNAGRRPAPIPGAVAAEIRDAGLVGLSRARMTPDQADVIPPRAALVFAPSAAAESLT